MGRPVGEPRGPQSSPPLGPEPKTPRGPGGEGAEGGESEDGQGRGVWPWRRHLWQPRLGCVVNRPRKEYVQLGQGAQLPRREADTLLAPQQGLGGHRRPWCPVSRRPGLLRLSQPEKPLGASPYPSLDPYSGWHLGCGFLLCDPRPHAPKCNTRAPPPRGSRAPVSSWGRGQGRARAGPQGNWSRHGDGRARGGGGAQTTEDPIPRVLEAPPRTCPPQPSQAGTARPGG